MTRTSAVPRRFTMDECQVIVRQLWPYLDGALTEREQNLVAQHVAECSKCEPHFRFARSFLHAVHWAHGSSPDFTDLRSRVVAALAAEGFDSSELT